MQPAVAQDDFSLWVAFAGENDVVWKVDQIEPAAADSMRSWAEKMRGSCAISYRPLYVVTKIRGKITIYRHPDKWSGLHDLVEGMATVAASNRQHGYSAATLPEQLAAIVTSRPKVL